MHCMTVNVYASWFFIRFSIIFLIYIVDGESDLSREASTATMTQLPAELIALLTRNQLPSRSKLTFIWWDDHLAVAVTTDQWASEEATSHCTAWNSKTFIPLPILIAISNTPPTKEGAISSKTVVRETTLFLIKINVLGQLVRHFYISTQTKSPSKMGDSY